MAKYLTHKTRGEIVQEKVWDHDDSYCVVEVQLPEGFKKGDSVDVTVRKKVE